MQVIRCTVGRGLFGHEGTPPGHRLGRIDPRLHGHTGGEVQGGRIVDGDPIVEAVEGESFAEPSLGDPGGTATGSVVPLAGGIDHLGATDFLEVVSGYWP